MSIYNQGGTEAWPILAHLVYLFSYSITSECVDRSDASGYAA